MRCAAPPGSPHASQTTPGTLATRFFRRSRSCSTSRVSSARSPSARFCSVTSRATEESPRGVADGRDGERDVAARAVLAQPHGLGALDALAAFELAHYLREVFAQ